MARPDPDRAFEVLLIEDSPADARLVRESLRDLPVRLHLLTDGGEALRWLAGTAGSGASPDLVLLDLNLPHHSGHEVLRALRADPFRRRTPVVLWTSSVAEDDVQASYESGANVYVVKPVELNAFVA